MKNILLLFLVFVTTVVKSQNTSYDYAYIRESKIYVYSVTTRKETFVAKDGAEPCISGDGKMLAYTINGKDNKMGPTRFIGIVNLATKSKTILNTHYNNCYGPVWSPDGKWIAYNVMDKADWKIAIIDVSNKIAPKMISVGNSFSPHWVNGGRAIVAQNMNKISVYNLSGATLKNCNFKDLEGGRSELKDMLGNASSDDFIITEDGKKIVFNCMINEPGENGPPSSVFVYDIASRKTSRLSPPGYFANDLTLSGRKVFFTASKINSSLSNVYCVDIDGKNYKLLFKDSESLSVR